MGQPAAPAAVQDRARPAMPYLPGLDGIRALAIVGVLLYHADIVWLPGGFLGVEVFFVVSGYLITVLLLAEQERTGRIRLLSFWRRRTRRLLPALLFYLAGSLGLAVLFARDVIDEWRDGVWAALLYVANWFGVFNEISYAEGFGRKSFLHHLWSLAIEEQFYLLWPVLLWAGLRFLGRRLTGVLIVAGIVASTTLMWLLHEPLTDPLRVYYGTDTRAGGLLVGAALAFVWRPWEWLPTTRARRFGLATGVSAAGGVGLAGVGWAMWHYDLALPTADPLFRGGFLITAGFTALAIAAAATPRTPVGALLGLAPLRWVGTRSYGIYLWHWPIFQITRGRVDVDLGGYELLALRLALTAVAAEVSYQLVERPIRERGVRRGLAALWTPGPIRRGLTVAPLAVGALIGAIALAQADFERDRAIVLTAPEVLTEATPAVVADRPPVPAAPTTALGPYLASVPGPEIATPSEPTPTTEPDPPLVAYESVSFIGDSVMEGAAEGIAELIPSADIDTLVGRQWFQAVDLVTERVEADDLGDAVVIHLGNNGPVTEEMVDDLLGQLVEAELVVVINVRVPLRWEASVNDELRAGVKRWDNTRLVNWYKRSNEKPQFFAADGVHIGERGRRSYVRAIAKALGIDPDAPHPPPPAPPPAAASTPAAPDAPTDEPAETVEPEPREPGPAPPPAAPTPATANGVEVTPGEAGDSDDVDGDGE